MLKNGVWRVIDQNRMPRNRRCVKCKWVFKIKRNGVFRARLVACGYSQIAGVDFSENYSPVVNDISFRIGLIVMIVWRLTGKLVDVETAFLNGDLEEDIYMELPEGMDEDRNTKCCHLKKSIYGLVQAARQWYKKLVKILHKIGFQGGDVDPCLLTRCNHLGFVLIVLYVDDCLMVGDDTAINNTIKKMTENGLSVKVEDELNDYLSCKLVFSNNKRKIWLGQLHLINNLEKTFGELVKEM